MDLNDIKIFVVAAEASTLTAAARKLRVPTSTVSRAITRLEEQLDMKLARRGARGITVTDVGRGYLDACQSALRALDDGERWVATQRSEPSGTLKVACTVSFARDILVPLLKPFMARYPQLKIVVDTHSSGLETNPPDDVDVFFEVRRSRESPRSLRSYPGLTLGIYASQEYVREHGRPTTPAELERHACVGYGAWPLTKDNRIDTPELTFAVETRDPESQRLLVQGGVGIGVLPRLWAAEAREPLVRLLPDWKLETMSFCALFFGRKSQTPKVKALLDFLEEYIGTRKDPRVRGKWSREHFES